VRGVDIGVEGNTNDLTTRYISSIGATFLVHGSRLPNSIDVAESLGIPLSPRFEAYHHEMSAFRCFTKAFKGHVMKRQFAVDDYHVDVYFPKYNIVVECDERDHTGYNKVQDAVRTRFIDESLKCKWVRFNPNASDFDILDLYAHTDRMTSAFKKDKYIPKYMSIADFLDLDGQATRCTAEMIFHKYLLDNMEELKELPLYAIIDRLQRLANDLRDSNQRFGLGDLEQKLLDNPSALKRKKKLTEDQKGNLLLPLTAECAT
jgi:very-short-patch-repair endonuclease